MDRASVRRPLLAVLGTAVVLALLLALAAPWGSTATKEDDGRIRVTTTTGMIADLVANVGGDRVKATALMGAGVDPHLYKPSAGDIAKIDDADVIFFNGLHLEGRMTDLLEQIDRAGTPTVAVAEGIAEAELRRPAEYEGQYDPHVWFDVTLWRQVAHAVKDGLTAIEPVSADLFQANLDAYLGELNDLQVYVEEQIGLIPADQRVLITAHDAFGYFGQRYGLEVRGLQGTSTAAEAGAGDVQALAELIAARRIPAIFVESSVSESAIEAVREAVRARGFDVVIGGELFADAMGAAGTSEGTYLGMVRHNVDTITAALAPQR